MNHRPLAFVCDVRLQEPSLDDKTPDSERLKRDLEGLGLRDTSIPLDLLRKLPEKLRECGFTARVVVGVQEKGYAVMDIGQEGAYGLALDIGTTNIACALYNLVAMKKIDALEIENPQVAFGADVLSRVQAALSGRSSVLTEALREGVNTLVAEICSRNSISPLSVYAVVVAGNTIMSHFFLGLDVRNISLSPYIPAVGSPVFCGAREAGIHVNDHAVVYVFPNAGSYVGGDIISGMLAAGIHEEEEPALFIDVGTNVEITLGCRDWIMVGAGAAGPALEGGIAGIGRKAEVGTIDRVRIDRVTKEPKVSVMGDVAPSGICGSGMIDLVAELYSAGIIDRAGRFVEGAGGVLEENGDKKFSLYRSAGRILMLTERELQNFLRTKAAMFAFLSVFLKSLDMTFRDVKKIYVAGALGCGINIDSAITIGMLPDIGRERFIPMGNTSLKGAATLLLDSGMLQEVQRIRGLITYREMAEDPDLLTALQGAMFIPHTNPDALRG